MLNLSEVLMGVQVALAISEIHWEISILQSVSKDDFLKFFEIVRIEEEKIIRI